MKTKCCIFICHPVYNVSQKTICLQTCTENNDTDYAKLFTQLLLSMQNDLSTQSCCGNTL